jgi:hypothetical protein
MDAEPIWNPIINQIIEVFPLLIVSVVYTLK